MDSIHSKWCRNRFVGYASKSLAKDHRSKCFRERLVEVEWKEIRLQRVFHVKSSEAKQLNYNEFSWIIIIQSIWWEAVLQGKSKRFISFLTTTFHSFHVLQPTIPGMTWCQEGMNSVSCWHDAWILIIFSARDQLSLPDNDHGVKERKETRKTTRFLFVSWSVCFSLLFLFSLR